MLQLVLGKCHVRHVQPLLHSLQDNLFLNVLILSAIYVACFVVFKFYPSIPSMQNGLTALHHAIIMKLTAMVKVLLEDCQCDPNPKTIVSFSTLCTVNLACWYKSCSSIEVLDAAYCSCNVLGCCIIDLLLHL